MNTNPLKALDGYAASFLKRFRKSPVIERYKASLFFWTNVAALLILVLVIAADNVLPLETAPDVSLLCFILVIAHGPTLLILRKGRYNLSVNFMLSVYIVLLFVLSWLEFHSMIGPEGHNVIFFAFMLMALAGAFATIRVFSLVSFFMIAALIAHAFVSVSLSSPSLAAVVRNRSLASVAAVILIYLMFYMIQRFKRRESISADDELGKNLKIMQALEETISRQTNQLLKEKNKLKELNREYELELIMACKIQKKLIPTESPADYIHIFYRPMKHVGGDFFDFLRFRNSSKIGIFVSDVAGHGIPAAFITSMVKSFILQSGGMRENPADLLYYLNNLLYNQTADNFVTAFYGIYDPDTRDFIFASAGHNPPFLVFEDRVEVLDGKFAIPLAVFDNSELRELNIDIVNNRVRVPRECTMLLYTDGLVEERNSSNLQFQHGPMIGALLESRKAGGRHFIPNLFKRLSEHTGSDSFYDDICMIYLDI